jgi:hypothetical protein
MRFFSLLTVILCLSISSVLAQPKIQFGVTTEGSWFMPANTFESTRDLIKDGFGAGIGVYASRNLFWRVSADGGVLYRYTQMKQYYQVYTDGGGYYVIGYEGFCLTGGGNGVNPVNIGYLDYTTTTEGWDKLPMHSLVVPIHLRLHFTKNLFVSGGIESSWLLNYEVVNEKPEFNWTVGFGSDKHKLSWSVNYIKGFKEQGFGDSTPETDGHYKGSVYRNNMLQLSLSYPIWQKK